MMETAVKMWDHGYGGLGEITMEYTNHGKDCRGRDAVMEGLQDEGDRISNTR